MKMNGVNSNACFLSGRMKPLSIEIGELTPVWKWQTQISSDSRDMDFWGRRDSEPWDRGKFAWENAVTL